MPSNCLLTPTDVYVWYPTAVTAHHSGGRYRGSSLQSRRRVLDFGIKLEMPTVVPVAKLNNGCEMPLLGLGTWKVTFVSIRSIVHVL